MTCEVIDSINTVKGKVSAFSEGYWKNEKVMGFVGEGDKTEIRFFEIYGNALPDLTVKLSGR